MNKENDPVNHPSHYTDGKIEVIEFIEDKKLPYHLGNAVKYIASAGKKNPEKTAEDLKKAVWYLERHITNIYAEKVEEIKQECARKVSEHQKDCEVVGRTLTGRLASGHGKSVVIKDEWNREGENKL